MDQFKLLENVLETLEIDYSDAMLNKLFEYRSAVLEWNEKVNLTSIKDPFEFEVKHFIDSISVCQEKGFSDAESIVDVGTGAGLPGIPLAVLFPGKQILMMDSLNKRIKIIKEISEALGIRNVSFYHGRVEDMGQDKNFRENYDLCVSRAVAELSVLAEYCIPLVRPGGYFAAYKTEKSLQEVDAAENAIKKLGGSYEYASKMDFKDINLDHNILWIKKLSKTPAQYPRKAGTPSKNPLR